MDTENQSGAMVTLKGTVETDPVVAQRVADRVQKALDSFYKEEGIGHSKTELQEELDKYRLLASYVQDLVDMWPNITLRTLSKATAKIADLKEALSLLKAK